MCYDNRATKGGVKLEINIKLNYDEIVSVAESPGIYIVKLNIVDEEESVSYGSVEVNIDVKTNQLYDVWLGSIDRSVRRINNTNLLLPPGTKNGAK